MFILGLAITLFGRKLCHAYSERLLNRLIQTLTSCLRLVLKFKSFLFYRCFVAFKSEFIVHRCVVDFRKSVLVYRFT